MATATEKQRGTPARPAEAGPGDQRVVMAGLDWDGYETMLRLRGDRSGPRMTYLDGSLQLVSPSHIHEFARSRLGTLIVEVAVALRLAYHPAGSTTLRRRVKEAGVEPDGAYYFANERAVRAAVELDLESFPPPDLAIEVVHTHDADEALKVLGRLGVPEVWVWEDGEVRILARGQEGDYTESATSLSIPPLTADLVTDWVARPRDDSELEWTVQLRTWANETLAPRVRGEAPPNPPNDPPA